MKTPEDKKIIKTFEEFTQHPVSTNQYDNSSENEDDMNDENNLYEMANLSSKKTGLPFIVWVSPKGRAMHDVRVKITSGPTIDDNWISIAIRPTIRIIGNASIGVKNMQLLTRWIELNYDTIIDFWNGKIAYTEDLIDAIRHL